MFFPRSKATIFKTRRFATGDGANTGLCVCVCVCLVRGKANGAYGKKSVRSVGFFKRQFFW